MKPHPFALLLLVVLVLAGECRFNGGEGSLLGGEGRLENMEETFQKRMEHKKGDHLYNNIAKSFTKMIQEIFKETRISNYCKALPGDQFIVEDKTNNNKDVTDQFPYMRQAFNDYKTDKLLTTDRDKLAFKGKKLQGPDKNALTWGKKIEGLKNDVFALINKFVDIQIKGQPQKETWALHNNLRERIDEIIVNEQFIDQDAKKDFRQENVKNKGMLELADQVERRSAAVLRELAAEANKWGVEATNFIKNKFKGNK